MITLSFYQTKILLRLSLSQLSPHKYILPIVLVACLLNCRWTMGLAAIEEVHDGQADGHALR